MNGKGTIEDKKIANQGWQSQRVHEVLPVHTVLAGSPGSHLDPLAQGLRCKTQILNPVLALGLHLVVGGSRIWNVERQMSTASC